ncbi:MAG: putative toxin-antitoxin system toxin component, PIN family [Spartobacteria bacterium]
MRHPPQNRREACATFCRSFFSNFISPIDTEYGGGQQTIHYLWRGILSDPKDDMVLEVAVAAGVSHIITFNHKHLKQASEFGIAVVTPSEFLNLL